MSEFDEFLVRELRSYILSDQDTLNAKRQFIDKFGFEGYKAWLQAFGGKLAQRQTHNYTTLITLLHNKNIPKSTRLEALSSLTTISEKQAYRLLATLPSPLMDHAPYDMTESEFGQESSYWIGIAGWLLLRETKLESLKPILEQGWKSYEARAEVSSQRYKMICKLIDQDQLFPEIFPNPELPWLLAEIACCQQRLYNIEIHTSKRKFYNTRRADIQALDEIENSLETWTSEDLDDFLWHFNIVVETLARDYTKKDPAFDQLYFMPYLSAYRTWNRQQERDKNFQPIRKHNQRERIPPKKKQ